MGSESGQSPLRIVPPVATRVVSSMQQRLRLNFKPSSSICRKSDDFFTDTSPSAPVVPRQTASKNNNNAATTMTASSTTTTSIRRSALIPLSTQLENLSVCKFSNAAITLDNNDKANNYCNGAIFENCAENGERPETTSTQFHEKSPSWPQARSKGTSTADNNNRRRQSSFTDQMHEFSTSVNEKLFQKKQRPDRGSFCKSTISSHDSGIGMQDELSAATTPVCTPTVGNIPERILNSRLVLDGPETVTINETTSVDRNDSEEWFGSSTPILKRKSLRLQDKNCFADIPLIDDKPVPIAYAHKNPISPDYDSETLRKSAQKNREIAARLLPKLNQRSPRDSKTVSSSCQCHERQLSLDGYGNSNCRSPRSPRLVTKSPSQLSCGGSSSCYTESSGSCTGSSSTANNNSAMYMSLHDNLKSYHEEQRDLIWRSVSIDTLGSELYNSKTFNDYLSSFNQPYQRTNIAAVVPASEKQKFTTVKQINNDTGIVDEEDRCVNSKDKNLARSMPNLNGGTLLDEETEEIDDLMIKRFQADQPTFQSTINFHQVEQVKRIPFESSSLNKGESPIYAVPQKSQNFARSLIDMRNPPPVPKKPSSSVILEQRISTKQLLNKDVSDECDEEIIMAGKSRSNESPTCALSSVDNLRRRAEVNGVVHPDIITTTICDNSRYLSNQRSHNVSRYGSTTINGNQESQSPRGSLAPVSKRPVVSVQPYHKEQEHHQNGFNEFPSKCSPSPRPPVPPKPPVVPPKPPQLPPKPTDRSQLIVAQPQENPQNVAEPQFRVRTMAAVAADDEEMLSRRSRIVAENEPGLIDILVGQQRQSVYYISVVFDRNRNYQLNETNVVENCSSNKIILPSSSAKPVLSSDDNPLSSTNSPLDLEKEKKNLIVSLASKLTVLKNTLREVEQEIRYNDSLGQTLRTAVEISGASSHDKEAFRLHVEDTEKITRLLLKLSAQLARVENELNRTPANSTKDQHVVEKRQRLILQLQDAKNLKEDLDKREDNVTSLLGNVFNNDQLADWAYFIRMKSQLLVDFQEISEKIKLGEDQKTALENSLTKSRASE